MDYALYTGPEEDAGANGSKKRGRTVQAGDLVIIMEKHDAYDHIYVKEGESFQNRFGLFRHSDLVGKPYGSQVKSHTTGKYVRLLSPTPELWTLSLKHRTQIVHELDQSFVIFMLGLKPGCVVVESGTGSGAMSTAIMRTISPHGHLHTIEFNESRAVKAREDFAANGLGHLVTVYHSDVCQKKEDQQSGGVMATLMETLSGKVDGVFLDVPDPWLAVPFAREVLKPDARVACYSPCIEQVARTCEALKKAQFHSLRTIEVRLKVLDVKKVEVEVPDFGDAPVAAASPEGGAPLGHEAVGMDVDDTNTATHGEAGAGKDDEGQGGGEADDREEPKGGGEKEAVAVGSEGRKRKGRGGGGPSVPYAKARNQMRGHTAFLTFASAGVIYAPDDDKAAEQGSKAQGAQPQAAQAPEGSASS